MTAIATFVTGLLRQFRVSARPAVDVEQLARRMDVDVREAYLRSGVAGWVAVADDRVRVMLRPRLPRGRRRFTLAHELGHVVLADPRSGATRVRRELGLDEERFCDRFAEAVLLPSEWLASRYGAVSPSLERLFECSMRAEVSAAAAAVALHRVAGWQRTLLRLESGAGGWRLLTVTGHLPYPTARLRTPPELGKLLDDAPAGGPRAMRFHGPVLVGGRVAEVPMQCFVRGRRAYVMAELGSAEGPA